MALNLLVSNFVRMSDFGLDRFRPQSQIRNNIRQVKNVSLELVLMVSKNIGIHIHSHQDDLRQGCLSKEVASFLVLF